MGIAGRTPADAERAVVHPRDGPVPARDAMSRKPHASEHRTRQIVDHAPDAFVSMGPDGRIIEWNLQAQRLFGWSREQALGCTVAELIVPESARRDHERGMARYLATGEQHVLNRPIESRHCARTAARFQSS